MNDVITPGAKSRKKSLTVLGAIAVGIAVLGLKVNDKLGDRRKGDSTDS